MKSLRISLALALAPLLGASVVQAATIPYTEDFEDEIVGATTPSEPSPESGIFALNGTFAVVSGGISGQSYSNTINADAQANALVSFSGSLGGSAATAQDFTLSSDFRFESTSANAVTLGLAFLAGVSGGAVTSGYYVDMGLSSDSIRLVKNGSTVITATNTVASINITLNQVYRLTISGIYVDSDANGTKDALDITATMLSGGSSVATFTYRDTAPSTGTGFGYRNRSNGATSVLAGQIDNFSVIAAVPEPSVAFLSVGSLAGLLALRRRR